MNDNRKLGSVDRTYHRMAVLAASIGFDVAEEDINGRCRRDRVSHARMTGYWLIRRGLRTPYEVIGVMFDRDHSGVMYGVKKIDLMLELGLTTYNNNWAKAIKESRRRFTQFHKARVEAEVDRKLKEALNVIESA